MTPEQVKSHQVHADLEQLVAAGQWEELIEIKPDSPEAWQMERVLQFATLARQRLAGTHAALTSVAALSALQRAVAQANTELASFRSSKNFGHILNAANALDAAGFSALSQVLGADTASNQAALGEIADQYMARAHKMLASLEEAKTTLAKQNEALAVQLAEQAAQIKTLSETVVQQKADAQATTAEVKRDYALAETDLRKQFQDSLEKQAKEQEAMIAEQKELFQTLRTSAETQASDFVSQLQGKRDEAARIVQIVGNIGVTGNYQTIAEKEGTSANIWRLITFGVFVVAAGFGALTLLEFGQAGISWQAALVRMVFAFVVASIALYTGRESARHRTNSDAARRAELELASLGPFMESLSPEERNEIRKTLAPRYFGNQSAPHTVESVVTTKDVLQITEKTLEALKELVKKG